MEQNSLLTYLILIPLIGSFLILLIKKEQANLVRYVALGISTIAFLVSLVFISSLIHSNSDFQFINKIQWINGLNIHYHVGIDGMSMLLVLLTTFSNSININFKLVKH